MFQAFYWLHRVALVLGKSKAGLTELDQGTGMALDQAAPWKLRLRPSALGFDDLADNEIEGCFLVVEYTLQP